MTYFIRSEEVTALSRGMKSVFELGVANMRRPLGYSMMTLPSRARLAHFIIQRTLGAVEPLAAFDP